MDKNASLMEHRLSKIPDYVLRELFDFLSNPKRYQQLESMLNGSSLMLDGSGYQIPIRSAAELREMKEHLENNI